MKKSEVKQLLNVCDSFVHLWYTFSLIFIYHVQFPILKFLLVENDSAFVNVHHEMSVQYAHIDRKSEATKVFFRANSKVTFLASWVTSQSLFPIVYLNSCHWEDSWICSIGRIYLCVFWSSWLKKHWPWNRKRCLDLFQFRACSFNSCS